MATFAETTVTVTLEALRAEDGSIRIVAHAASLTADGALVRNVRGIDVTGRLSAARKTAAGNLLTDVENAVRAEWGIA